MKRQKFNPVTMTILLLVFASGAFRVQAIPNSNRDMAVYNLRWYQEISQKGIGNALGTNFSNYAPPYTYLLALATLTRDLIPPLTAIKLIPIFFDLLGAYFIYRIVRLKYPQGNLSMLAAAIYFSAPTVVLNSAYWGQADSIYTSALLACLYFLLTEKPLPAVLAFGAAFSVKAQAVFLLPFLGVMVLRKKIRWWVMGVIPLVYLLAIAPVVLLGRPLMDALLVYAKQSDTFNMLSMNAPNIYSLFQREWYMVVLPFGLVLTAALTLGWMYSSWQAKTDLDDKHMVLLAFVSAMLIPFLLPKMHDRYFYPADVLSIVLAFYWPALWFMPILLQISSGGAIAVFLFGADSAFTVYGFLLNSIALTIALHTQRVSEKRQTHPLVSSSLAWLAAFLVPLALFGIGMRLLLTPTFIRAEYALPYTQEAQGLSRSERFQQASQTLEYMGSDRKPQFLQRLRLDNGAPVFTEQEITTLESVKQSLRTTFSIWSLSLAVLFLLTLLAQAGEWLSKLRHGVQRGGWITVAVAVISAAAVIFVPIKVFEGEMLSRLFPNTIWRDAVLILCLFMAASGFLLARSLSTSGGNTASSQ
ncbi:MAG TPA: hypothetical protein PLF18_06225 [Anaerolineales bacterium]|nr:hypothetical protein [Anaerolineales bacterium]